MSLVTAKEIALLSECSAMHGSSEPVFWYSGAQQDAEDEQTPTVSIGDPATCTSPEHDAGGERPADHADALAQDAEHEAAEEELLGQRRHECEQHAVADQRGQRLLLREVARELLLVGLPDRLDVDRGQQRRTRPKVSSVQPKAGHSFVSAAARTSPA